MCGFIELSWRIYNIGICVFPVRHAKKGVQWILKKSTGCYDNCASVRSSGFLSPAFDHCQGGFLYLRRISVFRGDFVFRADFGI